MYIRDRLISALSCLWLLPTAPFRSFPHFCWIVATERDTLQSYLAGRLTVWKITKCLCSWLSVFLGWRRSVPYFGDHTRRNGFYQLKYWIFRARAPRSRLQLFVVVLFVCFWLLLPPSFRALSRSAAPESPPLLTSPVSAQSCSQGSSGCWSEVAALLLSWYIYWEFESNQMDHEE